MAANHRVEEGGGAQACYQRSLSIMTAQREAAEQEALRVLENEVCQWLSRTLRLDITSRNFLDSLDTGVELCKLAEIVQTKAKETAKAGEKVSFKVSTEPIQCHKTAKKGSFHARENTKYFIEWCKRVGVRDDVTFESNGLVEHSDERRVVLCLLELSRLARRVHIKPPKIVEIENSIDESERNPHTQVNERCRGSGDETKSLDAEVQKRVSRCKCVSKKLVVSPDTKRPMFGKYLVSGGNIRGQKVIHVRYLSNTVMVRVGGGWVTLDHFLLDHDPCRIECLDK